MTGGAIQAQGPQLVQMVPAQMPPGMRWEPVVGETTLALLAYLNLPAQGADAITIEARRILGRCVPPTDPAGTETGLVIGYVQSGKTMSFTTVSALARDNGYRAVIVLTGTSVPLFTQSTDRLLRDLEVRTGARRRWKHMANPKRGALAEVRDTLDEWRDPTVPADERQTLLITVMKNHTHLRGINGLLSLVTLASSPVLVIDDEADQASLNTLVNQQNQSATYRLLLELKQSLPHHSFLQYTATPQAPLLINIIDNLSPGFAEVLTPGPEYVGGQDFFVARPELVRIIPAAEVPNRQNVMRMPPPSLVEAMRVFFMGVAAGLVVDGGRENRSMLVHPSQETLRHSRYFTWVRSVKVEWQRVLALPDEDPDRRDLIQDFQSSYDDLLATEPTIPSFDELLRRLPHALRRCKEEEVNARQGRTPQINWHDTYAHILVGGQAMDRGFTVKGLTVTYMPRLVGVGNADTVQQRARFLGYKRSYLGYCRVYLEQAAADAYRRYVAHEEDIRRELLAFRDSGQPLRLWKRRFVLAPNLRPCRNSVLDLPYMRFNFGGEWYGPRTPSADAANENRQTVRDYLQTHNLRTDDGSPQRTDNQRHLVVTGVPLVDALDGVLSRVRTTPPDESAQYTALLIQLQQLCETRPDATCTIYVMARGQNATAVRTRTIDANGELTSQLFQGEDPPEGRRAPRGSTYPGDRNLPSPDTVQVQVHYLRLERDNAVVADDVPVLAVRIVPRLPDDILTQPQ